MNGTKKQNLVRIIVILLIALAAIAKFAPTPQAVYKIELDPKSVKEGEKCSFIEGTQFDLIHMEVGLKMKEGNISQEQYEKFLNLSEKVVDNFTQKNIDSVYKYAARLLEKEVEYYYHKDVDPVYFMQGFAVQSAKSAVSAYYFEGLINEEQYKKIDEMYQKLMKDPSEEDVNLFLMTVGDALLKEFVAGEDFLPLPQAYIRINANVLLFLIINNIIKK